MSHQNNDRLAAMMNEFKLVAGRDLAGDSRETPSTRASGRYSGHPKPESLGEAMSPGATGSALQPQQPCMPIRPQIWARLVLLGCQGARS